jgi:hypothetical protein
MGVNVRALLKDGLLDPNSVMGRLCVRMASDEIVRALASNDAARVSEAARRAVQICGPYVDHVVLYRVCCLV